MTIQNLIITFLNFFKNRNYITKINNNIISYEQNNILFINSGIAAILHDFLNTKINKLATIQKCLRIDGKHNDFDNIGSSSTHFCSFHMLGTFINTDVNLYSVFKDIYDFLSTLFELKKQIYVTIHPDDKVSADIWNRIDSDLEVKILESNTWSIHDDGLFGYCTEIMYKQNDLEIWNIVIIDRIIKNGKHVMLPNIMIDTGGGLERIYSIFQDQNDIYLLSENMFFMNYMMQFFDLSNTKILFDSIKTINVMLDNNVVISNQKHGYIMKKIFRRLITIMLKSKYINLNHLIYASSRYINKMNEFLYIYNCELSSIQKCNRQLKRILSNKLNIDSKQVIKLYDTYGVNYNFTINYCNDNNIQAPTLKEVTSIEKHNIQNTKPIYCFDIETKFYNSSTLKICKYELYSEDYKKITKIQPGQRIILVADKTIFYPKQGGQSCDNGIIENDIVSFDIDNVEKNNDTIVHYGVNNSNKEISVNTIGDLNMKIDTERRNILSHSHTMHHILLATIESHLFHKVMQTSSNIDVHKTTLCFACSGSYSKILDMKKIANEINYNIINDNYSLVIETASLQNAIKNNYKMLFTSYPNNSTVIKVFLKNKLLTAELCTGTHIISKKFKIIILSISTSHSYNTNISYKIELYEKDDHEIS
jgi:alanyl-tRNA synthetase